MIEFSTHKKSSSNIVYLALADFCHQMNDMQDSKTGEGNENDFLSCQTIFYSDQFFNDSSSWTQIRIISNTVEENENTMFVCEVSFMAETFKSVDGPHVDSGAPAPMTVTGKRQTQLNYNVIN